MLIKTKQKQRKTNAQLSISRRTTFFSSIPRYASTMLVKVVQTINTTVRLLQTLSRPTWHNARLSSWLHYITAIITRQTTDNTSHTFVTEAWQWSENLSGTWRFYLERRGVYLLHHSRPT